LIQAASDYDALQTACRKLSVLIKVANLFPDFRIPVCYLQVLELIPPPSSLTKRRGRITPLSFFQRNPFGAREGAGVSSCGTHNLHTTFPKSENSSIYIPELIN